MLMSNYNIYKIVFYIFHLNLFFVDVLYSSADNVSLIAPKARRKVHCVHALGDSVDEFFISSTHNDPNNSTMFLPVQPVAIPKAYVDKDLMLLQEELLKKYKDRDIVAYWTTPEVLHRINNNQCYFEQKFSYILESLIGIDLNLQKTKSDKKDAFYRLQREKIQDNSSYDHESIQEILAYMDEQQGIIKDELWLHFMYQQKDAIHKDVERTKSINSYVAWPYIKEIAAIRSFQKK